jgi:hypothetical protein
MLDIPDQKHEAPFGSNNTQKLHLSSVCI